METCYLCTKKQCHNKAGGGVSEPGSMICCTESPSRPVVTLDPWPFHSPPPPRKCSAVASPSVPSPLSSSGAPRTARGQPELREQKGGDARKIPFSSSSAQLIERVPLRPSKKITEARTEAKGRSQCSPATKPPETRDPASGSACGEGRPASRRSPPSGDSGLSP